MKRHRENTDNEQARNVRARAADEQAQIVRAQARDIALNPSRILPYFSSSDLQSFARVPTYPDPLFELLARREKLPIPMFAPYLDQHSLNTMSRVSKLGKAHYIGVANQVRAAKKGDVEALVQAVRDSGGVRHPSVPVVAAENERFKVLKYATERNFPKSEKVAEHAVRNGRMDMLMYATEKGYPKSERVAGFAVDMGRMDMLAYVKANGYPKSKRAAKVVHQFYRMRGLFLTESLPDSLPEHLQELMDEYAVRAELFPVPEGLRELMALYAVRAGSMDVLKYVTDHDYPKSKHVAELAVEKGRMDMLKYVTEHDYPKSDYVAYLAVEEGRMDMLKYVTDHDYPKDDEVASRAVEEGRMDMLKYVTDHDYTKDHQVAIMAVEMGRMDMLKYATDSGYPKHKVVPQRIVEKMEFLSEHDTYGRDKDQFLVDALVYVTEEGYPKSIHNIEEGGYPKSIHVTKRTVAIDPDRFKMPRRPGTPDHDGTVLGYLAANNYPISEKVVQRMEFLSENDTYGRDEDQFLVDALVYVTEGGYPKSIHVTKRTVAIDPDRFKMPRRPGTPDHDGTVLGYLAANNYPISEKVVKKDEEDEEPAQKKMRVSSEQ